MAEAGEGRWKKAHCSWAEIKCGEKPERERVGGSCEEMGLISEAIVIKVNDISTIDRVDGNKVDHMWNNHF